MKKSRIVACLVFISFFSCKEDDTVTCTTCSAPETLDFNVCRESNGNASVNGEDRGTDYEIYLEGLQAAGASCGGN